MDLRGYFSGSCRRMGMDIFEKVSNNMIGLLSMGGLYCVLELAEQASES